MTVERPGVLKSVTPHTTLPNLLLFVLIGYSWCLKHQQEMLSCQENKGERDEGVFHEAHESVCPIHTETYLLVRK